MAPMFLPAHNGEVPGAHGLSTREKASSTQHMRGTDITDVRESENRTMVQREASSGIAQASTRKEPSFFHQASTRIRVLVVDDHEVVRKGICTVLNEEADFEVIGQTNNGNDAVLLAIQLRPDIVLLDIYLGTSNGLDVAQQLQRAVPETRIVIFTGLSDDGHLFRAMSIGVHGYLQKGQSLKDLLAALRAVHRGERVLGEPRAVTQVLTEFSRLTKEQERVRSGLSNLEIELVRLVSEGCSNKEIAARQFWSEVTVKRKMQDIYRKLQVADRAQAVAEAMRMGFI